MPTIFRNSTNNYKGVKSTNLNASPDRLMNDCRSTIKRYFGVGHWNNVVDDKMRLLECCIEGSQDPDIQDPVDAIDSSDDDSEMDDVVIFELHSDSEPEDSSSDDDSETANANANGLDEKIDGDLPLIYNTKCHPETVVLLHPIVVSVPQQQSFEDYEIQITIGTHRHTFAWRIQRNCIYPFNVNKYSVLEVSEATGKGMKSPLYRMLKHICKERDELFIASNFTSVNENGLFKKQIELRMFSKPEESKRLIKELEGKQKIYCAHDGERIRNDDDLIKHFACMDDEEKCMQFIHEFLSYGVFKLNLKQEGQPPEQYLTTIDEVFECLELNLALREQVVRMVIDLHFLTARPKLDCAKEDFVIKLSEGMEDIMSINMDIQMNGNEAKFIKYFIYMLSRNFCLTSNDCVSIKILNQYSTTYTDIEWVNLIVEQLAMESFYESYYEALDMFNAIDVRVVDNWIMSQRLNQIEEPTLKRRKVQ
eukprot:810394_1